MSTAPPCRSPASWGRSHRCSILASPYPVSLQGEIAGRKTAVALKMRRDDKVVSLQDIDVAFGSSRVKGKVDIHDAGPRNALTVNLASTVLDVADLPAPRAPVAVAKPATAGATHLVFTDAAVVVRRAARAGCERRSDDRPPRPARRPRAGSGPRPVFAARREARRADGAGVDLRRHRSPDPSRSTRRAGARRRSRCASKAAASILPRSSRPRT